MNVVGFPLLVYSGYHVFVTGRRRATTRSTKTRVRQAPPVASLVDTPSVCRSLCSHASRCLVGRLCFQTRLHPAGDADTDATSLLPGEVLVPVSGALLGAKGTARIKIACCVIGTL